MVKFNKYGMLPGSFMITILNVLNDKKNSFHFLIWLHNISFYEIIRQHRFYCIKKKSWYSAIQGRVVVILIFAKTNFPGFFHLKTFKMPYLYSSLNEQGEYSNHKRLRVTWMPVGN